MPRLATPGAPFSPAPVTRIANIPATGVARSYVSSNIAKGNPFGNVGGYSNPEVDKLFAEDGAIEKLTAEGGTLDQLVALGQTLEAIAPRLQELGVVIPELHESVTTLSEAVEAVAAPGRGRRLRPYRDRATVDGNHPDRTIITRSGESAGPSPLSCNRNRGRVPRRR